MGCPCNKSRQYGGASHAPLSYVNPSYQEPSGSPSSAQVNRLGSEPMLARPVLNATGGRRSKTRSKHKRRHTRRKGGFYPSAMGSLIQNGSRLLPAAALQGYRMVRNYKKSRKNRK